MENDRSDAAWIEFQKPANRSHIGTGPCTPEELSRQQSQVIALLDESIAEASQRGRLAILFSGGVDSGLLRR